MGLKGLKNSQERIVFLEALAMLEIKKTLKKL